MDLSGKKIIIGISGGIAAYKIPYLVRLLKKAGAEVKILMTPMAHHFVTPLTLSTLSEHAVITDPYDKSTGEWNSHVEYGLWADLMLIAPATANTMGKMANGIADNLLMAAYLSARCPVFVAPTMDLDMYKHPSTRRNIETLKSYGNQILEPNTGELASGLEGEGRMQEPQELFEAVVDFFKKKSTLKNKRVLISAGPTYEPIDPVRFIGNHSSGIMGYALAEYAAELGANVTLVSGPSHLDVKNKNISLKRVTTAQEMFESCKASFDDMDIAIMAAAVADYTPKNVASEKIKKGNNLPSIELEYTQDILKYLGQHKTNQILVGFALETQNELQNAKIKLKNKNLDFIVLNSLRDQGAGFGTSTNKIRIIHKNDRIEEFELKSKKLVAKDIIHSIENYLKP